MSIEFLEIHRRKEVSNMKTTGEKIRDLRLNLGLTQAELAEMTGITVRSITNYETDAATPRRLQLRKLCEALNTTEDYLLNLRSTILLMALIRLPMLMLRVNDMAVREPLT